ncbi:MAG: hypothetical protein GY701_05710 [Sulfitobacter sp.]|nr:hypothetical protein [Sulfitobacter sp.]
MGIDLSGSMSSLDDLNKQVSTLEQGDVTDPTNELQLQQAMNKYQEVYGTLSAILADMKSTCMSIIQKI